MPVADRLARWRVPLGFAFGAAVLWLARPSGATLAAGVPIALFGEAIRVWAAGHLNKAREVTTSGPYRWFAHPLYVGSSVMGIGLAVASGRVMVVVLVGVYLTVMITAAVRSEEAFLHRTFGDRYERYRRGRYDNGRLASDDLRRFAVSRALANREHRALAGLGVAILLLFLKATYNGLFWQGAAGR